MFSKELYELDKNTVQYMIDEMQDTIDAQKKEIEEMHIKQEKIIYSTIHILRDLNIPEQEIARRIGEQYQISEEQMQKYLAPQ